MATVGLRVRSDRAITQRQITEKAYEKMNAANTEQFKLEQTAHWENRMNDVLRGNRVQAAVSDMASAVDVKLSERRARLAALLSEEQQLYEEEMVEQEETPQQRMDKMAVRAYDLKSRRENERKAVVQEKLYQQWRSSIDDLRVQDMKVVELQTIAARDGQLIEKQDRDSQQVREDKMYGQLWLESYGAKVEREEREKALKQSRSNLQTRTLEVQVALREKGKADEAAILDVEQTAMKKIWAQQEKEAKEKVINSAINARQERKKMDDFAAVERVRIDREVEMEKQGDIDFVQGVLEREHALDLQEQAGKDKAKKAAVEFTAALKLEMARKAESEDELLKLQAEESERQWAKRYAKWEKEELARRGFMKDVYEGRAEQVRVKAENRDYLKSQVTADRYVIEDELVRLKAEDAAREEKELACRRKNQEELFRQMDHHQNVRHREQQQHAIEKRQSAIAEEKLRRACVTEQQRAKELMVKIQDGRRAAATRSPAPFATDDDN